MINNIQEKVFELVDSLQTKLFELFDEIQVAVFLRLNSLFFSAL